MQSDFKPVVLIVDDMIANLNLMVSIIEQIEGVTIKATSDPNEALQYSNTNKITLAILDIQLPYFDGFELCKRLIADQQDFLPVLFVTAVYQSEKFKEKGYKAGAIDYIYKPINKTSILHKARLFLDMARQNFELKQNQKELELNLSIIKAKEEENKLLHDDLQNQIEIRTKDIENISNQLYLLNEIIREVSTKTSKEELYNSVFSFVNERFWFESIVFYSANDFSNIAKLIYSHNVTENEIKLLHEIKIKGTELEVVLKDGLTVFTEEINSNSIFSPFIGKSIAIIPIICNIDILGFMLVISSESYSICENNRDVLRALGQEIGFAFDKIEKEEELRKYRNELEILVEKKSDELLKNEKRLRHIFKYIQDVYFETDLNGNVYTVSPSVSNISKYTREELLNTDISKIYRNKNDRHKLMEILHEEFAVNDYEVEMIDKDNRTITCSLSCRIILSNESKESRIIGSLRDISHRKEIELKSAKHEKLLRKAKEDLSILNAELEERVESRTKALQESEERFKSLYNNSTVGMYRTSPDGSILMANPAIIEIMGYKDLKELQTINTLEQQEPNRFREIMEQYNTVLGFESIWKKKDGTNFYARESARAIRDENGRIKYYEGVVEDITKQKKAEKELVKSKKLLQDIFDGIQSGIQLLNTDFEILNKNKWLTREFSQNRLRNEKHCFESVFGKSEKCYNCPAIKTFDNGEVNSSLISVNGENGSIKWYEVSTFPIMHDGKIVSVIEDIRDVTEKQNAISATEIALEREKELSQMKTKFVSMVSHELRTPMAGIVSSGDILRLYSNKLNEDLKNKINKHIDRIEGEVDRLQNIVSEVLVIGKFEAGKKVFKPILVDFENILDELTLFPQFQKEDTRKLKVTSSGQKRKLMLDKDILSYILPNIISNAFKYSAGKPSPKLHYHYDDNSFDIVVEDYGIGIPDIDKSKLFSSFFRASNVGNITGNGLGLYIIKRFVELHQGYVSIESKLNVGTKVKLSFPQKLNI